MITVIREKQENFVMTDFDVPMIRTALMNIKTEKYIQHKKSPFFIVVQKLDFIKHPNVLRIVE